MFGMGTGGSLRLLSPEIGQGPNPLAAARFGSVGSAIQLPPDFLLTRALLLSLRSQLKASHPQNRTGRNFHLRLTMTSTSIPLTFSHKLSFKGFGSRSQLPGPLSLLLFTVPFSLLPLSKIKPSTY